MEAAGTCRRCEEFASLVEWFGNRRPRDAAQTVKLIWPCLLRASCFFGFTRKPPKGTPFDHHVFGRSRSGPESKSLGPRYIERLPQKRRAAAFHTIVFFSRRPPATGHRPPATGHRPPAPGHRPPAPGGHRPPAPGHRPPAPGSRPPATRHRPPATGHQPPATGHRPPAPATSLFSMPSCKGQLFAHATQAESLLTASSFPSSSDLHFCKGQLTSTNLALPQLKASLLACRPPRKLCHPSHGRLVAR